MDKAQALSIVRSLANGVDPDDGALLDTKHNIVCRPNVVRALFAASDALEAAERRERRKSRRPAKTGEPWSEVEDRKLLAAFDAGRSLQELSAAHERTMGAIKGRLLKYGRVNA